MDTLVYAYAALYRLYQKRDRRTIWDNYEERGRIKGKIKDDKTYLKEILQNGMIKAREKSDPIIEEVKSIVGLG